MRVAIIEATEHHMVLDTMSSVIPQMRVISEVKDLATRTRSLGVVRYSSPVPLKPRHG
jgi:hypothetical protein